MSISGAALGRSSPRLRQSGIQSFGNDGAVQTASTNHKSSGNMRRMKLVGALTDTLIRKLGPDPEIQRMVHKEVNQFVASGARVTPQSLKKLQEKIVMNAMRASRRPGTAGSARSQLSNTLSAHQGVSRPTTARSSRASVTGSKQYSVNDFGVRPRTANSQAGRSISSRGVRSQLSASRGGNSGNGLQYQQYQQLPNVGAMNLHEKNNSISNVDEKGHEYDMMVTNAPQNNQPESSLYEEAKSNFGQVDFGATNRSKNATLEVLHEELMADPEPEVVEGIINEVKAKREAQNEYMLRTKRQEEVRQAFEEQKRERAIRAAIEAREEAMYKQLMDERIEAENAREAQIRSEIKQKEQRQREERLQQMQEARERQENQRQEQLRHDRWSVEMALKEAEQEREEERAEVAARRAAVRKQMIDNEESIRRKKQQQLHEREHDKKLMEDYHAMLEAQSQAHHDALAHAYNRLDDLGNIANRRRELERLREEEEKERVRREHQSLMQAVQKAELDEKQRRWEEGQATRAALDAQVAAKKAKAKQHQEVEAAQYALFQQRAKIAEEEAEEEKQRERQRRDWYKRQLDKQKNASQRLAQARTKREKAAVAAKLAELEDDPDMTEEVVELFQRRGRGRALQGRTITSNNLSARTDPEPTWS